MKTSCVDCKSLDIINENYLKDPAPSYLPKCSKCGGMLRPAVIWFGESLNQNILVTSFRRLENTDLLIVAGTSAVVYPVAEFPYYAKRHNPTVDILEFNLETTPVSQIASKTYLGSIDATMSNFFKGKP